MKVLSFQRDAHSTILTSRGNFKQAILIKIALRLLRDNLIIMTLYFNNVLPPP